MELTKANWFKACTETTGIKKKVIDFIELLNKVKMSSGYLFNIIV